MWAGGEVITIVQCNSIGYCLGCCTRSVNKVMRLIQYNSVLIFELQIEFVPFKIVPLGGYTSGDVVPTLRSNAGSR